MSSKSSKTERSSTPIKYETVTVGHVRRPHGVRGEVVVESMTDLAERFAPGAQLSGVSPDGKQEIDLTVDQARAHRGALLVSFDGYRGRDEAEALRDFELVIDRSNVPPAPEGAHYFFELVGCQCRDQQLGALGEVVDIVEDGGGVLLSIQMIEAWRNGQVLVPFVDAYLVSVDTAEKQITLNLPEGLVEICTFKS